MDNPLSSMKLGNDLYNKKKENNKLVKLSVKPSRKSKHNVDKNSMKDFFNPDYKPKALTTNKCKNVFYKFIIKKIFQSLYLRIQFKIKKRIYQINKFNN